MVPAMVAAPVPGPPKVQRFVFPAVAFPLTAVAELKERARVLKLVQAWLPDRMTLVSVELNVSVPLRVLFMVSPPEPKVSELPAVPAKVTVPLLKVRLLAACAPEMVIELVPVTSVPAETTRLSKMLVVVLPIALSPVESVDQVVPALIQVPVAVVAPSVLPFVSQ